jgi:hypothetical protein
MQNSLSEAAQKEVDELQKNYAQLITEFGDRHFRIKREQAALDKIQAQLHDLDNKYFSIVDKDKLKEESKDVNQ